MKKPAKKRYKATVEYEYEVWTEGTRNRVLMGSKPSLKVARAMAEEFAPGTYIVKVTRQRIT